MKPATTAFADRVVQTFANDAPPQPQQQFRSPSIAGSVRIFEERSAFHQVALLSAGCGLILAPQLGPTTAEETPTFLHLSTHQVPGTPFVLREQRLVGSKGESATYEKFEASLSAAFDEEDVALGEGHPADQVVERMSSAQEAVAWATTYFEQHPEHRRSLLLCIGRLRSTKLAAFESLVSAALRDDKAAVREAGVRLAEAIGPSAIQQLQTHNEPARWLASYIERVLLS